MNFDTTDNILWPHEDETIELRCTCCDGLLNDVETADPCIIDGKTFKDSCASNLTSLRLQGFVKQAADRTNLLVKQHDRDLTWAMGFKLVKFGTVKHI